MVSWLEIGSVKILYCLMFIEFYLKLMQVGRVVRDSINFPSNEFTLLIYYLFSYQFNHPELF